jgi:hypothetical protein
MRAGRFKSSFQMLAMIGKCVDQQRTFLLEHGELEGQDKIKLTLEALERAKMLMQEDLDLFQHKMRSKAPTPILPVRLRKAAKLKN